MSEFRHKQDLIIHLRKNIFAPTTIISEFLHFEQVNTTLSIYTCQLHEKYLTFLASFQALMKCMFKLCEE